MLSIGSVASNALSGVSTESVFSGLGGLGKVINNTINEDIYVNIPTKDLRLTSHTVNNIFKKDNSISNFSGYFKTRRIGRPNQNGGSTVFFEDTSKFDLSFLREMNSYRFSYKNGINSIYNVTKDQDGKLRLNYSKNSVALSLFNPYYGVSLGGISPNVPLMNGIYKKTMPNKNIKDCSISALIKDSLKTNSILGQERYRLIDFLYCKDLGKVSNNHLITLRRFPVAIGDYIGRLSNPNISDPMSDEGNFSTPGDIGRLVSWFDTDDNKLEDICKYEMQMEWQQVNSEIQDVDTQNSDSDKDARGPIGMLINTVTPAYNEYNGKYGGANNTIFHYLGSKLFNVDLSVPSRNADFSFRDANKIYTPKNTIQDTHLYKGKLTLNQEITLNFSYKLRAYDNINPKSAMLDLLGNILETTYNRGQYWAGARRMIGPPMNNSAWQTYNAFVDNAWKKLGGFVDAMASGDVDFGDILGSLSNFLGKAMDVVSDKIMEGVEIMKNPNDLLEEGTKAVKKIDEKIKVSEIAKGLLKSKLGRPALYAMNSLINGDNVGFWHLTIGNPYNPIMSIGNLIMTSSSIQHMGPLGVDDFPTELKVTVTLKPGRSRDVIEIGRYYTGGLSGIYQAKVNQNITDFHSFVPPSMKPVYNATEDIKLNSSIYDNINVSPSDNRISQISQRAIQDQYVDVNDRSAHIDSRESAMLWTHNQYFPEYLIRGYNEVATS